MIKRIAAVAVTGVALATMTGAGTGATVPQIDFVSPTLFSCTQFSNFDDANINLEVTFKNGLQPRTVKVEVNGKCIDLRKTFIRPGGFTRLLTRQDNLFYGDKACGQSTRINTIKVKGKDYTGCSRQSAFRFFYVNVVTP